MNLMISKTLLRHATEATHADIVVDILSYATGECALGWVLVARSVDGVCAILIGADHDEVEADLAARFPQATLITNEAVVRDDLAHDDLAHDNLAKVIRFVDNPAAGLHLTLDMRGTPLHRRVWEKLRAIPVGRTVTYTELARWISPLTSARVVAGACAANPIASLFLATASSAPMAIWRATAGASSASVNSSGRKPWHKAAVHAVIAGQGTTGR
jgi:AraC family transcriptional regulator, regulatory protein of adaptative response / methylated-DNA-[protein]-cysteine methyltransferase